MSTWTKGLLWIVGVGLLVVWPVRWAFEGLPAGWSVMEGGGAWPFHLLAEAVVAGLCLSSPRVRHVRPIGLLALGTLVYGAVNGLSYGVYGSGWHLGIVAAKLAAAAALAVALAAEASGQVGGRAHGQVGGRAHGQSGVQPRWPGGLLAFVGFGMIAFWSLQVASGMMKDGLLTAEGNAYLIFHVTAECLAGVLAVVGGAGAFLRRRGMVELALVGAGAVLYAAMNSLGWAVLNDAALAAIFVVSSVAAVAAAAGLRRGRSEAVRYAA